MLIVQVILGKLGYKFVKITLEHRELSKLKISQENHLGVDDAPRKNRNQIRNELTSNIGLSYFKRFGDKSKLMVCDFEEVKDNINDLNTDNVTVN